MRLVRYTYPNYRSFAPTSGARSPWSGLESEIDRLFDAALQNFGPTGSGQFPVDLYEDAENTYVRAELPGVNRDAIGVELTDGFLTITARKGGDAESASLSRSLNVHESVDAAKVSANYENGVLTVTLPKREEAKPRKINVAVK